MIWRKKKKAGRKKGKRKRRAQDSNLKGWTRARESGREERLDASNLIGVIGRRPDNGGLFPPPGVLRRLDTSHPQGLPTVESWMHPMLEKKCPITGMPWAAWCRQTSVRPTSAWLSGRYFVLRTFSYCFSFSCRTISFYDRLAASARPTSTRSMSAPRFE